MIHKDSDGIEIDGHIGTWFVQYSCQKDGRDYFVLEHEWYGEDAEWLYVDADGKEVEDDDLLDYIVETAMDI